MNYEVLMQREAEADVRAAYQWYEAQDDGLGEEFLRAIDARLAAIQRNPFAYVTVHKDVRRALLRRFPYALFYFTEADRIVVMACFHARRSQGSGRHVYNFRQRLVTRRLCQANSPTKAVIKNMDIQIPPEEISPLSWLKQVRRAGDPTGKLPVELLRRGLILRLIWFEPFLTEPGLTHRLHALLGRDCLGTSPDETIRQDIDAVRDWLTAAGHALCHSDDAAKPGYFVRGREQLGERMQRMIVGAVAEVDPAQLWVLRTLSVAQRFRQGGSMIDAAVQVGASRIRQRQPQVGREESLNMARQLIR